MQDVGGAFLQQKNLDSVALRTTFQRWNHSLSLQILTSLAQAGEELLLIDQHALHERIRYERLRNDESLWTPQPRLVPSRIQFTLAQQARLESSLQRFEELGFHLEKQDEGEWDVMQAPRLLDGDEVEPFLLDLLQDISEDGAPLETIERRKDHLAFLNACRGSVKANDTLTIAQMRRLLEDMRNVPNPWACVHGRPTALRPIFGLP